MAGTTKTKPKAKNTSRSPTRKRKNRTRLSPGHPLTVRADNGEPTWDKPRLVKIITDLMLEHPKSLERVLREHPKWKDPATGKEWDLPNGPTVRYMMKKDPQFREEIYAVKSQQLDLLIDDYTDQLQDTSHDELRSNARNGRLTNLGNHLRWMAAATITRYREKKDVQVDGQIDFATSLRKFIEERERGRLPNEVTTIPELEDQSK